MKKDRIFYLDFIRAISIIMIVTYHFAVHFATDMVPIKLFNTGKWGLLGVALFFMISGASLEYNYRDKFDLKTYYKKRFLGIYPVFWIAYSLVFLYSFWKCKGFFVGEPIYKLIFSFLGLDGYLSTYTGTFYLIGDWFLGCIILVYILFPVLKWAFEKFPKILITVCTAVYLAIILKSNFKIPLNQNLFISLYSFLMGMYFIKYIKKVEIWQVIVGTIISLLILVTYSIPNPSYMWKALLEVNFAAYCLFFVLCYWGQKINIEFFKNIVNKISKYSYVIFLLQHFVILQVKDYFLDVQLDKYGMLCVYLICWLIILAIGKVVYIANKKILQLFAKENH